MQWVAQTTRSILQYLLLLRPMPYLLETNDGQWILQLHVQPKGSKTKIVGLHDGRLKLTVASPPVDGKANKEVISFLASVLKIRKKDVVLTSGLQSRKKNVCISGLEAKDIRRILGAKL